MPSDATNSNLIHPEKARFNGLAKRYFRHVGLTDEEREKMKGSRIATNLQGNSLFTTTVRRDLDSMLSSLDLGIDDHTWPILLVQSVQGHAQQGHGEFAKLPDARKRKNPLKFPSATLSDIILGAGLDLQQTKYERTVLVDEMAKWVDKALAGRTKKFTLNGSPLLRANFVRDFSLDIESTLKGMVLAGYMDSFDMRDATANHYKHTIEGRPFLLGGGKYISLKKGN